MSALNENGPASAATDPDHGSDNSREENAVNEHQYRRAHTDLATADLPELWSLLTLVEREATYALCLALIEDASADPVAVMTPFIGREKAKAVNRLAMGRDA